MRLYNLDIAYLEQLIESEDFDGIQRFASENELKIIDGKIYPKSTEECDYAEEYWGLRQQARKIQLNALYGALLNPGCRFQDHRIGQSTTLTGRQIVKHMSATINEILTGVKDHTGEAIIYGDSVTGDTVIRTDNGNVTIEDLYNQCLQHTSVGEKDYGLQNDAKVLGFDSYEMQPVAANISYVMRHKTKKKIYQITTENGKTVKITEDHSIIVDRAGLLLEVKPTEIKEDDLIITLNLPK